MCDGVMVYVCVCICVCVRVCVCAYMYIDLYVCIHATVISGSRDKMMKLFDLSSGMEIRQFKGHVGRVLCCAVTVIIDYAPVTLDPIKRTLVATGSWDRSIKVCVSCSQPKKLSRLLPSVRLFCPMLIGVSMLWALSVWLQSSAVDNG